MENSLPNKNSLLDAYRRLDKRHPHELLPLERRLPPELRCEERDKYRVVMTMILSGGTTDKRLTTCLGKLFKRYPDFESMRNLQKHEIKPLLGSKDEGGIGLGWGDPDRSGNGGRLWSFLECYFSVWGGTIAESSILGLNQKTGFQRGHL